MDPNNPWSQFSSGGIGEGDYDPQAPLHNILLCPDCREFPPNLVEEFSQGDVVCGSCGLVLQGRLIDTRSEWRTFANDDQNHDDPNRVGDAINPLLNGSQLETSIGSVEPGRGGVARGLGRTQAMATESKANKNLLQAYKDIQAHCDSISVGKNVADSAKHIFKMVDDAKHNEAKHLKSKPQEAVIAGCIFVACRQCGVHRTFRDIFNLTQVSKKEIGRVFKGLEKFLSTRRDANKSDNFNIKYENAASTNAEDLCGRYCSQLGFTNPHAFDMVARELARRAGGIKALAGRSPLSIAAACIYMASHLLGQPKTSKEIASVAGVSDGTIKTAYKFLYQERNEMVDSNSPAFQQLAKSNDNIKKEKAKGGASKAVIIDWKMENLPTS